MKRNAFALAVGLIFGLGLCLSGMYEPAKVTGFLDLAGLVGSVARLRHGRRDRRRLAGLPRRAPALRRLDRRRDRAADGEAIDAPLVVGAAIFGIGWGLGGVCPAPGVVDLGFFSPGAAIFVVCDGGGHAGLSRRRRSALARPQTSGAGCVSLTQRARA